MLLGNQKLSQSLQKLWEYPVGIDIDFPQPQSTIGDEFMIR
ncbi:hypothetical protein [Mariniblastus fucicola]|nr:hypothetical protein [Mariniblastus fucicola]